MLGPHQGPPSKQGTGRGGDFLPSPSAPVHIPQVFHFSGFMLFPFRERHGLLCPSLIVQAITVRLQYFNDETEQSVSSEPETSPVCPFPRGARPRWPQAPNPRSFPRVLPPGGLCPRLCPCLCRGAASCPSCPPVCVSFIVGRMVSPTSPGPRAEPGRATPHPREPGLDIGVGPGYPEPPGGLRDLEGGAGQRQRQVGRGTI